MKAIKIFLWVVCVLVVLAVGGIFAVINLVDPNDFKPRISKLVEENTGRELILEGDIDLTFYPWIGITTGAMTLSNGEGFGPEPMLSLDKADIRLKLIPLLKKQLEIGEVLVIAPELRLTTLENGKNNWSELLGSDSGKTAGNGESAAVAALAVQGISIDNGNIILDDRSAGKITRLKNFYLDTGVIVPGVPLDVSLSGLLEATDLAADLPFDLSTSISVNEGFDQVKLTQTNLNATVNGLPVVSGISELAYDLANDSLSVPGVLLNYGSTEIEGDAVITNLAQLPAASGNFLLRSADVGTALKESGLDAAVEQFDLGELSLNSAFNLINGKMELNRLESDFMLGGISTSLEIPFVSVALDELSVDVPGFVLSQANARLNGDLSVRPNSAGPEIEGELELSVSDTEGLVSSLPEEIGVLAKELLSAGMPEGSLPSEARLESVYTFKSSLLELTNLVLETVGKEVKLDASIPALSFDLDSGELEVPGFSVSQNDAGIKGNVNAKNLFGMPEDIEVSGSIDVGIADLATFLSVNALEDLMPAGLLNKLDATMNVEVSGGTLGLERMDLLADQTRSTGSLKLVNMLADGEVILEIQQSISNLDVGRILSISEIYEDLEGKGELEIALENIHPESENPLIAINGKIGFRLTDGALKGFDLQQTLLKINDALKAADSSYANSEYEADASTRFTELSGRFSSSEGVLVTDDIIIKSPGLRIEGKGDINLPQETLNLGFDVNVVASVDGQGGAALEELKGLRIPLKVDGPIDAPRYGLDLAKLLEDETKKALKKELEKELQKELEKELQKELGEEVEKKLEDQLKDDLEKEARKKLGNELLKLLGE